MQYILYNNVTQREASGHPTALRQWPQIQQTQLWPNRVKYAISVKEMILRKIDIFIWDQIYPTLDTFQAIGAGLVEKTGFELLTLYTWWNSHSHLNSCMLVGLVWYLNALSHPQWKKPHDRTQDQHCWTTEQRRTKKKLNSAQQESCLN